MNPNAIVFVPSIKLDPEQERSESINNIQRQIIYQKELIQSKNVALTTLHSHLETKHSVLVNQMKRRENNEFPCLTQIQIDALSKEYRADSKIYYSKYAEFNDATSELVSLQQQLHKLLIINNSCSPPSSPKKINNQQLKNKNIDKDFAKQNKLSVKILDGIDPKILSPKGTATMTSPKNPLPAIIEDDDENAWNDDDDEGCDDTVCAMHDQCPSMSTDITDDDEYNPSMISTNHSHRSSPISVSPTPTPQPSNFTFPDVDGDGNGNGDGHKCNDKENKNPNSKQSFDSDEKNIIKKNKNQNQNQDQDQDQNQKKKKRIIPDYIAFENKIHTMLENIQYSDMKTPCDDMVKLIDTSCVNVKCVEILVDMIISHSVEHKPIFFGAKYALICQSIVNQYKPNKDIIIDKDDIDEYQKMKQLNVGKLVLKSCHSKFKKVSYGQDTAKFINVMIIIAELFNANLLDADFIFNTIFKSILCDSHYNDLWETDIEGIFEIFQRCTRHLNQPQHKETLYRYLRILDKIKNWRKFDHGLKRVPFMINQLKKFVNFQSLEREFANKYVHQNNHINNNNNNHQQHNHRHHRRNYHHHNNNYHQQRNHNNNNDYYNNTNYRRNYHHNNNNNNHNSYHRRNW